jgi:hypothetical protein
MKQLTIPEQVRALQDAYEKGELTINELNRLLNKLIKRYNLGIARLYEMHKEWKQQGYAKRV